MSETDRDLIELSEKLAYNFTRPAYERHLVKHGFFDLLDFSNREGQYDFAKILGKREFILATLEIVRARGGIDTLLTTLGWSNKPQAKKRVEIDKNSKESKSQSAKTKKPIQLIGKSLGSIWERSGNFFRKFTRVKLEVIALIIAIILGVTAIIVTITVPEIREFFGLDSPPALSTPTQAHPISTTTPSSIPTTQPTSTMPPKLIEPTILMQDDFLDNRNGWLEQNTEEIQSAIFGGTYNHTIVCSARYISNYCGHYFLVPNIAAKDFNLQIDSVIKEIKPRTDVVIGFNIRRKGNNYYQIYFHLTGQITMKLAYNENLNNLYDGLQLPDTKFGLDIINRYGVLASDTEFKLFTNGKLIGRVDDGNLNQPGEIYIVILISKDGSTTLELDNLLITEAQ